MNAVLGRLEKLKHSNPLVYYGIHAATSWPISFLLAIRHPSMFPELKRFATNQLEMIPFSSRFGFDDEYFMKLPKEGLRYESHSHTSNFSEDANCELGDVINHLFEKEINIWALTDHNNSYGFDQIVSGEYDLNKNKFGYKYELDINLDGRSLTIKREPDKKLVMLRAIEYWTDMGEIGIYGYNTKLPNEGNYPYGVKGKNIPLKEAIDIGLEGEGYIVINHPYDNDGIGWTNGENAFDEAVEAVRKNGKNRKFKVNRGILKRPFKAFTSLKRKRINRERYTRKFLEEAIKTAEETGSQKRFIAIEKNVAQVLPKLYCPVRAKGLAERLDLPFKATGDAHTLSMYARSGVVFDEEDYDATFDIVEENHADTVKALISTKNFENYFNYPTYGQAIDWVKYLINKSL